MRSSKMKKLKAAEFDKAFEKGDVTKYLDLKSAKVRHPIHRINIDIPRASLLKIWIVKCVDGLGSKVSRSNSR